MKKFIVLGILLLMNLSAFASPPGLSGKGGAEFPRGLENREMIPHGWLEGKKQGWDRVHRHHHNHHIINNKKKITQ